MIDYLCLQYFIVKLDQLKAVWKSYSLLSLMPLEGTHTVKQSSTGQGRNVKLVGVLK